MIKQDNDLERLVREAVDRAILSDPKARHPCVRVHRIADEVMLAARLRSDDRSSVLGEVCNAALRRGLVVEFEVEPAAR
jgi:hypothetical protein